MNGGGGIFGKMREGCDQEYAYKMEIIEDILNDFQELLRLEREFPYLNVTYNREIHTRNYLINLNLDDLDSVNVELNKYINFLTNLNNAIRVAEQSLNSGFHPDIIIRRIRSNANKYDSKLIIDALIRKGVYTPPSPKDTTFVYEANKQHYFHDPRVLHGFDDRKSASYSMPGYTSQSAGPMPKNTSKKFTAADWMNSTPEPENCSAPPPAAAPAPAPPPAPAPAPPPAPAPAPTFIFFPETNRQIYQMNLQQIKALKTKYRKKSKELHPDKGGILSEFQEFQRQWDLIKDAIKDKYDELTVTGSKRIKKRSKRIKKLSKRIKKKSKVLIKKINSLTKRKNRLTINQNKLIRKRNKIK